MFFSVYGDAYFLIGYGIFATTAMLMVAVSLSFFIPSVAQKKAPSRFKWRAASITLLLCAALCSLTLSTMSAFEYGALWYVSIAAIFAWAILSIVANVFWKLGELDGAPILMYTAPKRSRRRLSGSMEIPMLPVASAGDAFERPGGARTPPSPSDAPLTTTSSENCFVRFCSQVFGEMKSIALQLIIPDMKRRWKYYVATWLSGLAITALLILITYGACICSQPSEISTWLTRRSKSATCAENTVCHQYTLLGKDCTEWIVVAHVVLEEGSSNKVVSAKALYTPCNPAGGCNASRISAADVINSSVSGSGSITLTINDRASIREDPRFVVAGAMPLSSSARQLYAIVISVTLDSGATLMSATPLVAKSVSCTMPSDGSSLAFIGGGDYRHDGSGKRMLSVGTSQSSAALPEFFFIGGDLAYANNMRRCYRRWDKFLRELTSGLTISSTAGSDGGAPTHSYQIPILAAVGNHEGGGYLQAATANERAERYAFYIAYFPHYLSSATTVTLDGSRDSTLTFHSHAVWDTLGIVVVDSDIMVSVREQIPFIRQVGAELPHYRDPISQTANQSLPWSDGRRLMFIYHNPAYPSIRRAEGSVTQSVLEHVVPEIETLNSMVTTTAGGRQVGRVACVFEHHDHAYKRTIPIRNNSAAALSSGGIVYIGDGALGATPSGPMDVGDWYIDTSMSANYVLLVRAALNGTVSVTAVGEGGATLDTFVN